MQSWIGNSTENRWTDSSIWPHGHSWTLPRRRNAPNSLPQAAATPNPLSAWSVDNYQKWPFPVLGPAKNKSRRTTSAVARCKENNCIWMVPSYIIRNFVIFNKLKSYNNVRPILLTSNGKLPKIFWIRNIENERTHSGTIWMPFKRVANATKL